MQEALQQAVTNQGTDVVRRCALSIKGCGADVTGMQTVVVQGKERNGH